MAKVEKDTSPKGEYPVLSPLHHDGELYDVGDKVTLTERQAKALPEGTVELPKEKAAK
ncbi:MAG TPA: hypothetical protein VGF92_15720 [Stellaceae bacterium]|jgi:hypothetical protein